MKKYSVFLFVTAVLFTQLALSGCGRSVTENDGKINDYINATEYHDNGKRVDFCARVNNIGKYTVNVTSEGDNSRELIIYISSATELIGKNGEKLNVSALENGMRVIVTYDGTVVESDPPRIMRCYTVREID